MTATATSQRRAVLTVLGAAALFLGYVATAQWNAAALVSDTVATNLAAWRLAFHGDGDLSAYAGFDWIVPFDGGYVSNRFAGSVLSSVPFHWLTGSAGTPSVAAGAVAGAAWAAAAVLVVRALLLRVVDRRTALGGTLLVAFGTATWTVSADQAWTHGPAQACVGLGLLLSAGRRWLAAGLAFGGALTLRPHLAVVPLVVGVWLAAAGRSWRPVVGIGGGSAVGLLVLGAYNAWLVGSWSPLATYRLVGYDPGSRFVESADVGFLAGYAANLAGTLVSPARGVLLLMPAVLLLLPGLPAAWRAAPAWVRAGAVAGQAYLAAQLWVNTFGGADGFFGNRLVLEPLVLAAPLLALCWTEWTARRRRRRQAFGVLAAVTVAWHALAAVLPDKPPPVDPWRDLWLVDLARLAPAWAVAVTALVAAVTALAAARALGATSSRQPVSSPSS